MMRRRRRKMIDGVFCSMREEMGLWVWVWVCMEGLVKGLRADVEDGGWYGGDGVEAR
jgi:hypothetical protein